MASIQLLVPLASGRWYLFHENWISKSISEEKRFEKKKNETKSSNQPIHETIWNRNVIVLLSLNEARDNTGKYLSREYRVANPENLYRGNAILSIHRDCYGYFVPRNRITRKVIVRLMISLTGTDICFPPFPRCNCKCDVIIPARYRLGIRLTG